MQRVSNFQREHLFLCGQISRDTLALTEREPFFLALVASSPAN